MKCKKKQEIPTVEYEVVKGTGAFRAKGTCPVCHGKVGVFVGVDKLPAGQKASLVSESEKIKAAKKTKSGGGVAKKSKKSKATKK
jgi:hypothetical protein